MSQRMISPKGRASKQEGARSCCPCGGAEERSLRDTDDDIGMGHTSDYKSYMALLRQLFWNRPSRKSRFSNELRVEGDTLRTRA
jgi:hypothetical protein